MKERARAVALKAAAVLAAKKAKVVKIEHALVGVGALGLASGLHFLEIAAAIALVVVELGFMFEIAEG